MIKFFCLLFPAIITCKSIICQVKPPPVNPGTTTVKKFKPPVVTTFLGRNVKSANITASEANQLLSIPLKITDDKNIPYPVSSYQFLYRKKSIIENETTGKKEVVFTIVSDRFKATPLPQLWVNNIAGGLQKDEELYFFDIVVTDKLNRKFFAPDVKLRIQ